MRKDCLYYNAQTDGCCLRTPVSLGETIWQPCTLPCEAYQRDDESFEVRWEKSNPYIEKRRRTVKFDKLVRDRIPEIIAESGKRAIFRVLRKDEFWSYLEKKLDEEIAELRECTTAEGRKEELEDIRDVVMTMMQFIIEEQGKTPLEHFSEIISAKSKRTERGGFDQRICLLEIEDEE